MGTSLKYGADYQMQNCSSLYSLLQATMKASSNCTGHSTRFRIKGSWNLVTLFEGSYGVLSGWWLTYPSEKYEFVSWDDDIPNIWKVIKFHGSSHHQPVMVCFIFVYARFFLAKNHETWAEVAGYAATPQRIHVASRRQPPAPHRWAAARNCQ